VPFAVILATSLVLLSGCGQAGGRPAAERPVAVPRVVGEQREPAERRLEAVGLEVRPRERFSKRPEGTVLAQRPRPGERVGRGSAVRFSVSAGPPPGPYGELRPTGIGPLEVGASPDRVLAAFGPPDRREERNLGVGPAPEVDWTWRLQGGGALTLHFDARRRRFTGFCTDSTRFATADGLRVGEVSIGMLGRRYGDRIAPARIGRNTYLLSSGRRGTYPALAFTFSERSTLIAVCGGQSPPAGD
jgi:hypothetical protein